MVLNTESYDKRIRHLTVNCECGCEQAISFVRYEEKIDGKPVYDYYINFSVGLFYERQRGIFKIIKNRLKICWNILRGKEYRLFDVNINKAEINKIISSLEEMKKED